MVGSHGNVSAICRQLAIPRGVVTRRLALVKTGSVSVENVCSLSEPGQPTVLASAYEKKVRSVSGVGGEVEGVGKGKGV